MSGTERAALMTADIRAASERGASLIRQVLTLLRRQPSKPEPLNLGAAVEDTRSLLELVLGPRVQLVVEVEHDLADALVERDHFDHVLLNLAANARDAMPAGGKVTIVAANVASSDGSAAQLPTKGAYVSLSVTDDGVGMAPEVRERVFERFYTTKPAGQGTGLGLATAYRFVKRSGGCIAVRSAPGQGTAVVLYLPRVVAPAPAHSIPARPIADRSTPVEDGPRGHETVLLIEADDPVRGAVRAVLAESGYRVIDAPSGDLAVRQAEIAITPVELVIADLRAPGLGARDVMARLRAAGQSPRLLWMSGEPDGVVAEHRLEGEPLLRKAFTPLQLVRRVREVLDAERDESVGA